MMNNDNRNEKKHYWYREMRVPAGVVESVPEILNDEDVVIMPAVPDGFCMIIIPVMPDHNDKLHVRMEKTSATPLRVGGLGVRARSYK